MTRSRPVDAEVDVEIRHRDAFGIEEALEQQAEAQRIEIGDGQRVGDERAGAGAAARPDRDVVVLRPLDEVGDDQEVARKLHPPDDADLVGEPVAVVLLGQARRRAVRGEPRREPLLRLAAQLLALVEACGVRPARRSSAGSACACAPGRRSAWRSRRWRCSASGRSANSSIICWRVLKSCSGESRRRFVVGDDAGPRRWRAARRGPRSRRAWRRRARSSRRCGRPLRSASAISSASISRSSSSPWRWIST